MSKQRPKNLNLFTIRFPIPAIASILHRISGVVLFLAVPLALWALGYSLSSQSNFQALHEQMTSSCAKLLVYIILAPFIYHFVAGIRHLLMDVNLGITAKAGRLSANLALIISIILMALAGIYLW